MIEMEPVCEVLIHLNHLTQLSVRDYFIRSWGCKSLKMYKTQLHCLLFAGKVWVVMSYFVTKFSYKE